MLDTTRKVATPEGIELTLRLAGPVPRAMAWAVDLAIRAGIVFAVMSVALQFGRAGWGVVLLTLFFVEWLLPAWLEAAWRGQTPGKRVMRLAVLNDDGTPGNETTPVARERIIGHYKKSKYDAQQVAVAWAGRGLPVVIVNPSTPIGPRDVKPTPTGRIIVEGACGRMPGFVDTGLNLAHVDDVAAGHLAALRRGGIGERYILGGENVRLGAMLADIADIVGRRRPTLRFPIAALYPIALGAEWFARLTGKEPFATRDGLRMARHYMFFNDAKARRELGYTSRPYREAIADAIAWFKQAGYVR